MSKRPKYRSIRNFKRSNSGLTFFEVLIVTLIVIVLSSVGVVTYKETRDSQRIKDAALNIRKTFDVARAMAIRQNTWFSVRLDLTRNEIWIDEWQIDSNGSIDFLIPFKQKITTIKHLPDLIHFEDVTVQQVADSSLQSGLTIFNAPPHAPTDIVDVFFGPTGTSDYAVIQLLQDGAANTVSENFFTIKLYSSTATAKIFEFQRM